MRLFEVASAARPVLLEKKLGRAFNHLEDLVFFYGTDGAVEAIQHLRDFGTEEGAQSIRMKWDGYPQVYWGREKKGGKLILAGHNSWSRGVMTDNPKDLEQFIAVGSGNPKTEAEKKARATFAKWFAGLYPMFDKATPDDFEGFVYADLLFNERPKLDKNGVYNFCPNPNSGTCYHVSKDSDLGKRIAKADVMVVGHAYFPQFGMADTDQQPIKDFSMFNGNPQLIVLGPIYNERPVKIETTELDKAEKYARQHGQRIDKFLESMAGLSDLKEIIYRFVNQTAKAKKLDQLSSKLFYNWLADSKVSKSKKEKIATLDKEQGGVTEELFTLVKMLQDVKDTVIAQVEGKQGEIWDTKGEGRVRYADKDKKFGNVKLVPRKQWTPN
jgi:hypothetical protein